MFCLMPIEVLMMMMTYFPIFNSFLLLQICRVLYSVVLWNYMQVFLWGMCRAENLVVTWGHPNPHLTWELHVQQKYLQRCWKCVPVKVPVYDCADPFIEDMKVCMTWRWGGAMHAGLTCTALHSPHPFSLTPFQTGHLNKAHCITYSSFAVRHGWIHV